MSGPKKLLYLQVLGFLQEQLDSGYLEPGDRLPSERELAARFGASIIPVRQATARLAAKGLVVKRPGSGTFVCDPAGRTVQTGRVGVLYSLRDVGFMGSPFYGPIMAGIEEQAADENLSILLRSLRPGSGKRSAEVIKDTASETDGLILVDPTPDVIDQAGKLLSGLGKPVVVLNYEGGLTDVDTVVFDGYGNVRRMVEYLVRQGHTNIGFAYSEPIHEEFSDDEHPSYKARIRAFREAMILQGLPENDQILFRFDKKTDEKRIRVILEERKHPTAFICFDDTWAINLCRILLQAGYRVPEDVSVTGYNGIREAESVTPALTTVKTPLEEMGKTGVSRVAQKIAGKGGVQIQSIVLPALIAERQSHRRI